MINNLSDNLHWMHKRIEGAGSVEKIGKVTQVTGLIIQSEGPEVSIGEMCDIYSTRRKLAIAAEVVGFRENRILLMPLGAMQEIHPGCRVVASSRLATVPTGEGLIGRIIDGLGEPLDDKGPLRVHYTYGLHRSAPNPMKRQPVSKPFQTGVRSIDTFTPLGRGQRMGVFAGSGVGKSTVMGMISRGSEADLNVIALVGERGRELREFIENDLGPEGMAKSIVIVSTSDQPAPLRLRAALLATAIAESYREEGSDVLLLMDSVTRFAMAQREIGLAVGEPPTSRGYTPSVFSVLPRLLERTGMGESGSITALYTILVDGDDLNEPVADSVRGILDGHIILSRALATANHYPPVDVLESVSRLNRNVCSEEELNAVSNARDLLALYRKNEDLINIGAYVKNSNLRIDQAIAKHSKLTDFLIQSSDQMSSRNESFTLLKKALQ